MPFRPALASLNSHDGVGPGRTLAASASRALPTLPLPSVVTLGKLLRLCKPQIPDL